MALLFVDGFDAADYSQKWVYPGGNLASSTSTRFGVGRSIAFGGLTTSGTLQKSFTAVTKAIVGMALMSTSYGNGTFVRLYSDGGATQQLGLQFVNATTIGLFRGATQIATAGVSNMAGGAWSYVEIMATLSDTVGMCKVVVNGQEVINFSGDTKNGGTNSTFDSVILGSWTGHTVDDFYLCDDSGAAPYNTFLGDIRIHTLTPNAAGSLTQMTPSTGANYTTVDELPYSATDYVRGSSGQTDLYASSDLPAGVGSIFGIQTNAVVKKTDAGNLSGRTKMKAGATTANGASIALNTTDLTIMDTRSINPDTSLAWTAGDINSIEVGVEAI